MHFAHASGTVWSKIVTFPLLKLKGNSRILSHIYQGYETPDSVKCTLKGPFSHKQHEYQDIAYRSIFLNVYQYQSLEGLQIDMGGNFLRNNAS